MSPQLVIPIGISGCGWVTPVSVGNVEKTLAELSIAQPARDGAAGAWYIPDEHRDAGPSLAKELQRDKTSWVAALAVEAACRDANLAVEQLSGDRVGLVIGSALAGQAGMLSFANEVRDQSARFVSPIHFPQTVGNYVAGALARSYKIRGPNSTLACGSASGLAAVAEGCSLLNRDEADIVVAGGVDTLSEELAAALGVTTDHPSEGACMFILRRVSGATTEDTRHLARVTATWRDGGDSMVLPQLQKLDPVLSCDEAVSGAVQISTWTGHCFAALGAAALAAGIGNMSGIAVPVVESLDPPRVAAGRAGKADDGARLGCAEILCRARGSLGTVISLMLESSLP